jgi:hypothetical protein
LAPVNALTGRLRVVCVTDSRVSRLREGRPSVRFAYRTAKRLAFKNSKLARVGPYEERMTDHEK